MRGTVIEDWDLCALGYKGWYVDDVEWFLRPLSLFPIWVRSAHFKIMKKCSVSCNWGVCTCGLFLPPVCVMEEGQQTDVEWIRGVAALDLGVDRLGTSW